MSEPKRYELFERYIGTGEYVADTREAADGDYVLFADYETVVRERDEAREAIKRQASAARSGMDAATRVSSAQLERAARLRAESNPDALESERAMNAQLTEENEQLRTLLDGAPHEHACSFNICPMCDSRKSAPLHDDVHMKQEYHHAFQNGKCNCWKSRIPRAGG